MTAALTDRVLPGHGPTPLDRVLRTLALAHVEGLDVRSALDAAFMVISGTAPDEAVTLAGQDAHDPRVKKAANAGTALISDVRVSTGEGPAEPTWRNAQAAVNAIESARSDPYGDAEWNADRNDDHEPMERAR